MPSLDTTVNSRRDTRIYIANAVNGFNSELERGVIMERRTMKRNDKYEIEERIGDGDWQPVCECRTIDEAKEILRSLRLLEEEK